MAIKAPQHRPQLPTRCGAGPCHQQTAGAAPAHRGHAFAVAAAGSRAATAPARPSATRSVGAAAQAVHKMAPHVLPAARWRTAAPAAAACAPAGGGGAMRRCPQQRRATRAAACRGTSAGAGAATHGLASACAHRGSLRATRSCSARCSCLNSAATRLFRSAVPGLRAPWRHWRAQAEWAAAPRTCPAYCWHGAFRGSLPRGAAAAAARWRRAEESVTD